MYTLWKERAVRKALLNESPSFAVSICVAEVLFKFHSFALEWAAFLVTWTVLSYAFASLRTYVSPQLESARNRSPASPSRVR